MILTEDNFDELYIPIQNHLDENASFDGNMFETFGPELDFVFSVSQEGNTNKTVWTILETDGNMYCSAGFHLVNRMGFIITEKPWETGTEEFMYEGVEKYQHLFAEGTSVKVLHENIRISDIKTLQKFLLEDAKTTNSMDEAIKDVLSKYENKPFVLGGDGDGLGFILDIWNSQEDLTDGEDVLDSFQFWFEDYEE